MPSHFQALTRWVGRHGPASMFPSTRPIGERDPMRASAFRRHLAEEARADGDRIATQLSTLSPSLLLDLMRFERDGHGGGVVEVLAAGGGGCGCDAEASAESPDHDLASPGQAGVACANHTGVLRCPH